MKFSILINTHNQQDYIIKAINSCINQNFKNYEVIIYDSSDKKINSNFTKIIKKENIKYFHIKQKYNQPEKNQMYKVLLGFKKSKGNFICLLDGDDFFSKKKLSNLDNLISKKKLLFNQDNPILINKKINKNNKIKKYKNNFIFNFLINEWPQIYGTSSIVVNRKILEKFFRKVKPFYWKFLAIDVQLILFCKSNNLYNNFEEKITYKNLHQNNLGSTYLSIFKKKFWSRRYMQHKYYHFINKNKNINLDYLVTTIIYFFIKFL